MAVGLFLQGAKFISEPVRDIFACSIIFIIVLLIVIVTHLAKTSSKKNDANSNEGNQST